MPSIAEIVTGALTGLGNTASSIIKDFKADPNKVLEADQRLKELEEKLEEAKINLTTTLEAEYTKQLQTVNTTIQAEAKSDHFLTYSWRPILAYVFGLLLINNYIIYPYLHNYGIVLLPVPPVVWLTLGSILGVTSIGRSIEKIKAL